MKESNLAIQLLAVGSVLLVLMILTVIVIAVFFDKNNRIAWSVGMDSMRNCKHLFRSAVFAFDVRI